MTESRAKKIVKEAKSFMGDHDCYIHIEMKGGKDCSVAMGGSIPAIHYGIGQAIQKVADYYGNSFDDVIELLKFWDRNCGFL